MVLSVLGIALPVRIAVHAVQCSACKTLRTALNYRTVVREVGTVCMCGVVLLHLKFTLTLIVAQHIGQKKIKDKR